MYRFDKDSNQWKERGTGHVKLLKHKETGDLRIRASHSFHLGAYNCSCVLQCSAGN